MQDDAIAIKLGPNKYACPYCSKVMKTQWLIQRHIVVHTGEKPFVCNSCDYRTNRKSSLESHIYRIHQHYEKINF